MDNRQFLRKKVLARTKKQLDEKFAGKEVHIIKASKTIEDLESSSNLLHEALADWKKRSPAGTSAEMYAQLEKNCAALDDERKKLSAFIEQEMKKELPNFTAIATPSIGAKLLAEAGSKKNLAFIPSSTMQLLGAEKALFNHIKKHALCPKHGHLFNHPLLQKLPKQKRGKAARIIAGKLSVAAKMDYFSGKDDSKALVKEVEDKIRAL